jgi:hypothetical protein
MILARGLQSMNDGVAVCVKNASVLRKERRDETRQQAVEDEFKRYPLLFPSRKMRSPEVLTIFLCSNGVENGVTKEQAETRIFIG